MGSLKVVQELEKLCPQIGHQALIFLHTTNISVFYTLAIKKVKEFV